jgi:hypothetical protein
MSDPSLLDVASFVCAWTGIGSEFVVCSETRLEADLGVTGDDSEELLNAVAKKFGVELANTNDGYRATFSLSPNEYLFSSEGFDLPGIGPLIGRICGNPNHVVRDLTVGQLHTAIVRAVAITPAFINTDTIDRDSQLK